MSLYRLSIRNFTAKRPHNCISSIAMIIALNRNVHINHHHLFDETPHGDISSLNSLLSSYIHNRETYASWNLFLHMHRTRCDLNSYTFTPVLKACSVLPNPIRGLQVHGLIIKMGLDSETIVKTVLIDMYSNYGQLGDSIRVFDEMGFKDVVTWNAMLSNFLDHGLPMKALGIFEEMTTERVEFSEFTLCSVLTACSSLKAYRQGKQVHALVIVMGRDLVVLSTALIDFYSNCGYFDDALKIYNKLLWRKDDIMCNSLISGCVRNQKYDVAMSIMSTMKPNTIALTSALSACSENSDLWIGKQIHGVGIRQEFTSDIQLCNAILNMYAKCGKILTARVVFEGIPRKDVVSWTSMIDAYGTHGHGVAALEGFEMMRKEGKGVFPNSVTFLAVLSACGHSGMVEQGRNYFALFQEKYGIDPCPEHYACVIDILGRAGLIEEVWCLYNDMVKNGSTKPTAAVWAAILNACRINQDFVRGEFAAKHLFELEPNKPGNYVALSNFYAAIGNWDSVDNLRSSMKSKGISKDSGTSWVTVAGGDGDLKTSSACYKWGN
ncbi:unnamed protein product [Ilex paraguariensis]|uniref:Pentatricopeptide repeat-containing protein n=1 Tax=Ilex paraguariensis TaxID=185542 RepID=A0ABC8S6B8_9AQUA